jgi:hypothetical protein
MEKKSIMEIVPIIVAIGVPVLIFLIGIYINKNRHKRQERQKRIDNVVNRYMQFRRANEASGLIGLQNSGIANLKDDAEIREAVNKIINYGERDPLKNSPHPMDNIDLKTFFDEARKTKLNYFQSRQVKQLIDKIKNS